MAVDPSEEVVELLLNAIKNNIEYMYVRGNSSYQLVYIIYVSKLVENIG